jgi:hypothetical protein
MVNASKVPDEFYSCAWQLNAMQGYFLVTFGSQAMWGWGGPIWSTLMFMSYRELNQTRNQLITHNWPTLVSSKYLISTTLRPTSSIGHYAWIRVQFFSRNSTFCCNVADLASMQLSVSPSLTSTRGHTWHKPYHVVWNHFHQMTSTID